MDLQSALIGIGGFVISAAVLLLISMFGMKEKSYEEAVAEQRKQTNELLGTQHRPKPKEKKQQKKAGKKVKEKKASPTTETETAEESENTDPQTEINEQYGKHHVEFKDEADVVIEENTREVPTKRRQKRDKGVRPILVNRDSSAENIIEDSNEQALPASNHFEESHPKDDCELLQSHIEETKVAANKETKKNKHNIENEPPAPAPHKNNKKSNKHQLNEVVAKPPPGPVEKEEVQQQQQQQQPAAVVEVVQAQAAVIVNAVNTGKEKKKKKSELNTIQQLAGDKQGVNLSALMPLVRKAEISRSEVQILIDMLLNKQHEAPAIMDEWSEGKADPVQKLKKQLAEKEKLLTEEQQALAGAQAKLREIRAEQNTERAALQQRLRTVDEALNARQTELLAANARAQSMNQKMQQMQAQLNEEAMNTRKLIEEHNALQMQWQSMEIRHAQEAEVTVSQLRIDYEQMVEIKNQLTMELHNITDKNNEQIQELLQRNKQYEESIIQLKHQLDSLMRSDAENKADNQKLKSFVQQHAEEARQLENISAQNMADMHNLQKLNEDLQRTISKANAEKQSMLDELSKLQLAKTNGAKEENKTHQVELLNLHNELASVKSQMQQANKTHEVALDTEVTKMKQELEEQKNKNNELRQKNWKVMEALNAAESRNKTSANSNTSNASITEELISKIRLEEQHANRKLVQRLFPDIPVSEVVSQDQWFVDVGKAIEKHVASLVKVVEAPIIPDRTQEVIKLQSEVQGYKTIINDTEGILKKLQKHIEEEEINWRTQLRSKDSQIEALREQTNRVPVISTLTTESQGVQFAFACIEKSLPTIINELTTQLAELEEKFQIEKEDKDKVMEEFQSLKNECQKMGDISEEVTRLRELLQVEQNKNAALPKQNEPNNVTTKAVNHNSTSNGPSAVIVEPSLSTTSSTASSVTEVTVNKKNKKKKKKNNGK